MKIAPKIKFDVLIMDMELFFFAPEPEPRYLLLKVEDVANFAKIGLYWASDSVDKENHFVSIISTLNLVFSEIFIQFQ